MKELSQLTVEEIYQLPFDTLEKLAPGKVQQIIPSVKFSTNFLERNRYYIDIVPFTTTEADDIRTIMTIAKALWMPEKVLGRLRSELNKFKRIPFFGVGESRGKIAYRIYLGFGGKEETTGKYAISIDWIPGTGEYAIKTYDNLGSVTRKTELAVLRECLSPDKSSTKPTRDRQLIYEQCTKITAKAGEDLHLTLVYEEEGHRSSVAFNYHKVEQTSNADIQTELNALAKVFELQPEAYSDWFSDTAGLKILDVAVGQGWNEEPFFTIYHGYLSEPAPYYHNKNTQSSTTWGVASTAKKISGNPIVPVSSSGVMPSGTPGQCGCGGGDRMQIVYALGELETDFGTQARQDSFTQAKPADISLLNYLDQNPWEAQSLIWTLNLDTTPIYAIVPSGAYASLVYDRLRSFLRDQNIERVSIPGHIAGSTKLMSGQTVPIVVPEVRGMYGWSIAALIEQLMQSNPTRASEEDYRNKIREYLERIYYEFRNLGTTPQERALNFSATNAFQIADVMSTGTTADVGLDTITVEKSPICRPDSECYDVKVKFFNLQDSRRAGKVFRFTVDVSEVNPVSIGRVRSWSIAS